MTLQSQRTNRINDLRKSVILASAKGVSVNQNKLVAESCRLSGTTKRTVCEYVEELILCGDIINVNGELMTPDFAGTEEIIKQTKAEDNIDDGTK